ncbi:LysR family transcriptional regulator [Enterovirga rhinocerotis]|uniref:LysR family transcriptional regulator n=1 Tax=Enterovirga rhinocerotis TaxID=1339210 RepID=A0A4R7BUC8_9HYPH|nr:LysR family transcriptional regulator [Enterovirga rhinocerotis]TDR88185.1 LysR family transcriptional regulator [Enterovirga rhinocerotis]
MAIDLKKIRYFVAVFEEGSFTRAARRENVVQPALSVQITQLERELTVKLLERSAQGVRPTLAGERYYRFCTELLRSFDAATQEMRDLSGRVTGLVRIGVMPSICHGPLVGVLDRYLTLYPGVELRLLEGFSGTLADGVASGQLDLAICNRPVPYTQLTYRHLVSDRLILISGAAKKLPRWKPVRLDAVPDLKLVLPFPIHAQRRLLDEHMATGAIKPARILEIDGISASLNFVRASDWSILLPTIAIMNEVRSRNLILNPLAHPVLGSEIYEMHPSDTPLTLPAQRFVELLQEGLSQIPDRLGKLDRTYSPGENAPE